MAPCPGADEAIQFSIDHPEFAIGVHLTHTNEWQENFPWGAMTGLPSLQNEHGRMWPESEDFEAHCDYDEAVKEIQMQQNVIKDYDMNALAYKEKILFGEQLEKMKKSVPELPAPPSLVDEKDYEEEKRMLKIELEHAKRLIEKENLEKRAKEEDEYPSAFALFLLYSFQTLHDEYHYILVQVFLIGIEQVYLYM